MKEQFAAAYLKQGVTHGIIYEIKILTWVAWKLLCGTDPTMKNWYLGTEVRNALGFHDLVLKYEVDSTANGNNNIAGIKYRFVQMKHRLPLRERARITLDSLGSKKKKNQYSLIYLFKSYVNMLGKFEMITMEQVVDLTVFTNVDIDSILFLVPVKNDPILGFEGKGKRYRLDIKMIKDTCPIMFNRLRQVKNNDEMINDFLRKLTFAVGQPSESELEDYIVNDMKKEFDVPQIFYNDLYKNMMKWFAIYNSGKAPYLTEELALQYLLDGKKTLLLAKQSKLCFGEEPPSSEQLSKRLSQLQM